VAAVAGVATFNNLVTHMAGTHTLTASDATDHLSGFVSTSFVIGSAAPSQLAFTTQPVNTVAGATVPSVKVAVEDAYGNVVTYGSSIVGLTLLPGGTLNGTVNGSTVFNVATFSNLNITAAGTGYTLQATDSTLGIEGTSHTFNITPAAAKKLVFATQPADSGSSSGVASFNVDVEDQYGNLETSNTSTVTVALASGPAGGTLSGTKAKAAVGGVATFSTLVVSKNGTYQLKATDGSLTSATSLSWAETSDPPPAGIFDDLGGGLLDLDDSGDLVG